MESVFLSIFLGLTYSLFLGKSIEATSIQNRIVGGYNAEIGSAPYQVSLRDDLNGHFCGGSILNKRWILTAAHCVDSDRLETIYVGSNFLNRKGRTYDVEKKIVHEKYDPKTTDKDIGLIKVKEDIEFSDLVQSIKPYRGDIKGGEVFKATGWGLLHDGGEEPPNTLQEVMLTALSDKECARRGPKSPNHLCTFVKEDVGVCNGDSGGPLVNEDGEQVGITSFTLMACADGSPDYFTKVSLFVDWIDKHVKGTES